VNQFPRLWLNFRRLAEHSKYEGALEDMLRDYLVCGISDRHLQHQLLAEPSLKFKKALEMAQAVETAEQRAKDLQQKQQRDSLPLGYTPKQKCAAAQAPPHFV